MIARHLTRPAATRRRISAALVTAGALLASPAIAQLVSQSPLHVAGDLPGNLALVPSVEWPTINSVANLDSNYSEARTYAGYFDSGKCYQYVYSSTEANRYFNPVSTTADHRCTTSTAPWSGNFLNWVGTQTIDPFRKALTGGYRVRDTTTETWLEKAHHDGQGGSGIYPNRRLPESGNSSNTVSRATPFSGNWMRFRIEGLGNKMRFRVANDNINSDIQPYDPISGSGRDHQCTSRGCEVSMRVKVCVPNLLEPNCKQYGSNYKPEGTLQEYSDRMRYAAFGYLNDHDMLRDGGALRARMKYIGPTMPGDGGPQSNPNAEWSGTTGVLVTNPDPDDADATDDIVQAASGNAPTLANSGVINYINRFGQMTGKNHKNHDPVSELYYTAIRYFRNLGNVSNYTNLSGDETARYELADGFPVITNWDDPVQEWCQPNVILGIGDIYTHRDKNLPGANCGTDEPSKPATVGADDMTNVVSATNRVGQMEGLGNLGNSCNFTGRENSAFMAGLAWDARTRDNRPDLTGGKTTISTYWVDVLEAQSLEGMARNQYALTAKYGGARVPIDFDPDEWGTQALPEYWWHTNGETLTPFGSRGSGHASFKRPDNFFTAGEANAMVDSLTKAFSSIAAELTGSGSSLATTSTKLDAGTRSFQAQFFSGSWRGELKSYAVNPANGGLIEPPVWIASAQLPAWNSRNIRFHDPTGNSASQRHKAFTRGNLNATQRTALGSTQSEQERVVDYLRGSRAAEQPNGALRTRSGILGDIVYSQPVFVGQPNPRVYAGKDFSGATSYAAFVNAQSARRSMVYVGANDGMLHGFDANTGVEVYAFIPNRVILNNLKSYTSPSYEHKFFVDGELTAADAYFTSNGGNWKTVLVGSLGRGGPGLFALDVTDPDNVAFLWEKTASDISGLGRNLGKPIIAQVANGDWRVILGNGPDSSGAGAKLIMISLASGDVTTIDTGATGANGLTSVYTWDTDLDGFADAAYAGDLQGNLWRFDDISGVSPTVTLLFAQNQPITAAPLVGKNPDTGARWVFFGTGQYLNDLDKVDQTIQSWYGLIDPGTVAVGPLIEGRNDLVPRDIIAEGTIGNFGARVIEPGAASDFIDKKGWYIDFVSPENGAEGERMVLPNFFQGSVLIGTTRIPDSSDVCRPSGRGFVMAIDPFTGGRLSRTFFDISLDGLFNDDDKLLVNGVLTIVSGIGFSSGPNNPVFIEHIMQTSLDDGTVEEIATSGSAVDARRTSWRELVGD